MILAYFKSSRGLEVASKSSVLSVAYHKVQSWSLRKGLLCVACHASVYNRNICHVLNCCSYLNTVPQLKPKLNNAETKKSFHEFSFIKKAGAALVKTITSILIYIPEPTGRNTPEYRSIFLDSDLRIPRSAILFLSPCEDITAGTRHLLAPLLQPIPRRDRWAGHICHVDISLGLTKIEARAKMSSYSVLISSVMPTPRVCSVTFRLHDNKGTTFVPLYRLSRPQTPPTFLEKVQFSSMIHLDSENVQFED